MVGKAVRHSDYRNSHQAPEKALTYDSYVEMGRYGSLVWEWERSELQQIVDGCSRNLEVDLLDFACGTGRIIAFLEDRVSQSIGVDVSEAMLQTATSKIQRSKLIRADLTEEDVLGDARFHLITCFRFFLNAQDSLRHDVMTILARHLANGGQLVFNNHLQRGSIPERTLRVRNFIKGRVHDRTMSLRAIRELTASAGLRITEIRHWGVLPASNNRLPLPPWLLARLELWASKRRLFRALAGHILVICKRT